MNRFPSFIWPAMARPPESRQASTPDSPIYPDRAGEIAKPGNWEKDCTLGAYFFFANSERKKTRDEHL